MNRKFLHCFILATLFLYFLDGCDRPKITGVEFDKIDTSHDPIQKPCTSNEPILIEIRNGHFKLTPLTEYQLSGMVVGKETYSFDWESKISPIDLAIVWGKLAEDNYDRYITYRQSNRWYFYQYPPGSPFDNAYVVSHSSNNHIISANKNIYQTVKFVKKKNKVVLEGFLVNLAGIYDGRNVTWNTSLSRADTGNGSCELFYVTKIRIDNKVYE